jgi:glycosyltransferase involved in cell wall biosynthesis
MRIAYIVTALSDRAPVKVVATLTRKLAEHHKVDVYYFDDIVEVDIDARIHRIRFSMPIDFDAYDIVHSHGIRPDAYVWWHQNRIKKAKAVTTLHSYIREDLASAYNPLISFVFSKLWNLFTSKHDQIIVLSNDAKNYYLEFWLNKNIDFIYNGISEECTAATLQPSISYQLDTLKNRYTILGAIGLLTKTKGFDQIIKAVAHLPNHALVVVGNGKEEVALKTLAEKLGLGERVLFLGFQSDIPSLLNAIDIVVVPSRSEGFSLVLQEAARQKKPVVCSSIPIFHELFSDNEVSFFELENIDALKISIQKTGARKKDLGNNIYAKFLSAYTSEIMSENYLEIYKKLLKSSS